MYQRILLPLDLAPSHEGVFETALCLVTPQTGSLLLLHVIESVSGLSEAEREEFYAPLRKRAEELIRGWAQGLEERGAAVQWEVRTGKRGPEVVQVARSEGCDLLITTVRAPDPQRPGLGIGTTGPQIALLAPCSVLLVR